MEPKFQTSFIPKKSIGIDSERVVNKDDTDIFQLTATIVFLATALLYGGLFGYKYLLEKQIKTAGTELDAARSAIEPEKIKDLIDASSRIKAAVGLLERHLITSKLLVLLGDSAIKKLRFNEFQYENRDNNPTIRINGEVQTYNALAYQQDILSKIELLKNLNFSNISLGDGGFIKFVFSSNIDPSLVSYKKSIESLTTQQ